MKNLIMALALTLSIAAPLKSQAVVSAVAGAPLAVGAITMGLSVGYGTVRIATATDEMHYLEGVLFGGIGAFIGLIILDDQQTPAFAELDNEKASKLGVTAEQAEIFNSEIEEVNGVFQNVLNTMENNKEMTFGDVRNEWLEGADYLSPETFEVLEAISANK